MGDPPGPSGSKPHTRPRWLKISLIIAIVVVLLLVLVALVAGGEHGPGRHLSGGDNSRVHAQPVQHSP